MHASCRYMYFLSTLCTDIGLVFNPAMELKATFISPQFDGGQVSFGSDYDRGLPFCLFAVLHSCQTF